jgi:hypothetical protein
MIGIYKIENKVNGKVYVGQSIHIEQRWSEHKAELRGNYHHNAHLQSSWNKYGEDNFEFSIIEVFKKINKLNEREIYWINYYDSYKNEFGYNLTTGGCGTRKYNDDDFYFACELYSDKDMNPIEISTIIGADRKTIERWLHSATELGLCNYEPNKSNWIKVICLNTRQIFDSVDTAQSYYKINGVSAACKGKHRYIEDSNGARLMWMYYKDYIDLFEDEIQQYIDDIEYSYNLYSVVCLNDLKEYSNAYEASKSCNLKTSTSINQCCNGKTLYSGKGSNNELLVWRYKKDFDKMSKEDIDFALNNARIQCRKAVICLNNLQIFDDTFIASDWCDCNREIIKRCCRGTVNSAGNHPETKEKLTWAYLDDYNNMSNDDIKQKIFLTNFYGTNPEKRKRIICINTLKIFDSMQEAGDWCNLKNTSMIGYNLRKNKSIGRHPITKQKLYWMYYEEYLQASKEYIDSIIPTEESGIVCVETNKIFGLAKDARDYCGINSQDRIIACCKGNAETSGGYHWKYYKDYIKENNESTLALFNESA